MSWSVLGEVGVGRVLSRFPWSQSQAHGCVPVQAAWHEQQRCWRVAVTPLCWGEHSVAPVLLSRLLWEEEHPGCSLSVPRSGVRQSRAITRVSHPA